MHLFQGHRTSSEPLWHVGLPPLFTQAYIHSLHRFLAHFMICDDYFMISSGFPFCLLRCASSCWAADQSGLLPHAACLEAPVGEREECLAAPGAPWAYS